MGAAALWAEQLGTQDIGGQPLFDMDVTVCAVKCHTLPLGSASEQQCLQDLNQLTKVPALQLSRRLKFGLGQAG
jgi:hypothetical protein